MKQDLKHRGAPKQEEEQPNSVLFIDLFIETEILMQDLLFELISSRCAEREALLCPGGRVCVRAGVCRVL